MATPSTFPIAHPGLTAPAQPKTRESRLRRLFRRRVRHRRAVHVAWRDEATLRALTLSAVNTSKRRWDGPSPSK